MDFMKKLEPGKHEVIEGRLNRIPKSTMFVAIEAGNKIETNIRQINNIFKWILKGEIRSSFGFCVKPWQ